MEDLKFWLHKNLPTCCASHSARHIEMCKRAMNYAVKMEYIINNPLYSVETKRDKTKGIVYLEPNEIKKLMIYNFTNDIYRIVADLYVYQCFTGLSYSDIYSYDIVEINGKMWLSGERTKNGTKNDVYIFPEAMEIFKKYDYKMPVIANQTYNRILKEVALATGIKKHLTTHTGRKTHATLLEQNGASTRSIMNQLGHKSESTTNTYYIAKTTNRTSKEFEKLGSLLPV
jgi:integrase